MTNIGLSVFVAFGVFVNVAVPNILSPADVREGVASLPIRGEIDPQVDLVRMLAGISMPAFRVEVDDRLAAAAFSGLHVRSNLVSEAPASLLPAVSSVSADIGYRSADGGTFDQREPVSFVLASLATPAFR